MLVRLSSVRLLSKRGHRTVLNLGLKSIFLITNLSNVLVFFKKYFKVNWVVYLDQTQERH